MSTNALINKYPLDAASIDLFSYPQQFREWLIGHEIRTFADLRRHWQNLNTDLPAGYTLNVRTLLAARMSTEIYCVRCGAPYMLTISGMLCEEHGPECGKIVPYRDKKAIRRAFPDRIVS